MLLAHFAPDPKVEVDFDRYYVDVHLPERAGLAGFGPVHRFIAAERDADGRAALLTVYELEDARLLHAPAYVALGVDPYMAEVLAGSTRFYRVVAERTGDDLPDPGGRPPAAALMALPPSDAPPPLTAVPGLVVTRHAYRTIESNIAMPPTFALHTVDADADEQGDAAVAALVGCLAGAPWGTFRAVPVIHTHGSDPVGRAA